MVTIVIEVWMHHFLSLSQATAFKNFDPFSEIKVGDEKDVEAILVFLKALYLSISTATLCGGPCMHAVPV